MGLEQHVNDIIEEKAPHLRDAYYFAFGRMIVNAEDAKELSDVLDMSREFGTTSIDEYGSDSKEISFGIFGT